MVELIIDANILRQDPRFNGATFRTLICLSRIGLIQLSIPYIVEKEYLTAISEEISLTISEIAKTRGKLQKYVKHEEARNGFDPLNFFIEHEYQKLHSTVLESWIEFKKETNINILQITKSHGKKVMDDYFEGNEPYKSPKSRNDIPDSFIFHAIKDYSKKKEYVYFVSNDTKLFSSVSSIKRMKCFRSLDDFLHIDEIQAAKKSLESSDEIINLRNTIMYSKELFLKKIKNVLENYLLDAPELNIAKEYFVEHQEIDYINSIDIYSFDIDKIYKYTDGNYSLPISCKINLNLSIFLQRFSLSDLPFEIVEKMMDFEEVDDVRYKFQKVEELNIKMLIGISFLSELIFDNPNSMDNISINIEEIHLQRSSEI